MEDFIPEILVFAVIGLIILRNLVRGARSRSSAATPAATPQTVRPRVRRAKPAAVFDPPSTAGVPTDSPWTPRATDRPLPTTTPPSAPETAMPEIAVPEVRMPDPAGPTFRFKTADEIIRDAFGKVTVLSGEAKPGPRTSDRS